MPDEPTEPDRGTDRLKFIHAFASTTQAGGRPPRLSRRLLVAGLAVAVTAAVAVTVGALVPKSHQARSTAATSAISVRPTIRPTPSPSPSPSRRATTAPPAPAEQDTHGPRPKPTSASPHAPSDPAGTWVDDSFATGNLSSLLPLHPAVTAGTGEVAPSWSAGGGEVSATASRPWFGLLRSGVAPPSPHGTDVVVIKTLASGKVNSNSAVFVGLVKDASDYVMGWYNTHHYSGQDLVLNGQLQPKGYKPASFVSVTLQPGDRFALQLDGNTVNTYYEAGPGGPWTLLASTSVAPLLNLNDPATLSQYHFAFGLRGDSGPMSLTTFRARPTLTGT